jgi:uncharacterized protein (UPF0548 family)
VSRWRILRPWKSRELQDYLAELPQRSVNFAVALADMTPENGWTIDGIEDTIGHEPPGPPVPDGLYERAKKAIVNYEFSDPRIVTGHFDPTLPLEGRNQLLEISVLGVLWFLGGVRVHSVRDEVKEGVSYYGFRYDTLEGHFENGFEWFLLLKNHSTGEVRFKIEAHWRPGQFPTWWAKMGFTVVGERFRELWRRRAVVRVREAANR